MGVVSRAPAHRSVSSALSWLFVAFPRRLGLRPTSLDSVVLGQVEDHARSITPQHVGSLTTRGPYRKPR